jgi:hypothetical protein
VAEFSVAQVYAVHHISLRPVAPYAVAAEETPALFDIRESERVLGEQSAGKSHNERKFS